MTITFDPTDITVDINGHVVCFPAMSQKDIGSDDPVYMQSAYTQIPGANYYTQHAASASARGKPGTCTIHSNSNSSGGVVNMFVRLYTGNRTLSNDNHVLRIKNFKSCLMQLLSCQSLSVLHFQFPCKEASDRKDYILAVEDFWSTYKLNNRTDLRIIVHHEEPKERPQIMKKLASTSPEEEFVELVCSREQINEQPLYEVDFVRYKIKKAAVEEETVPEIFKYFPKDTQWNFIIRDPELQALAKALPMDTIIADNVYPPPEDIFNAFGYMKCVPKVVLLGQDPYHRKGQAHGLSFSVQRGVAIPPSLRNVYKALTNDISGFTAPKHGNLKEWAEQGVLMLNSALTVEDGQPASHLPLWEAFTDRLVVLLSKNYQDLVFMLWGTKSKAKKRLISGAASANVNHLILECQHPSPQIANNTFEKDCTHFSQSNGWLKKHGKEVINWSLSV